MAKKSIPNFGGNRTMPLGMKNRFITDADIKKIKDEATAKAVEILEKKYNVAEIRRQAILDATEYLQEENNRQRKQIREEMYDDLFKELNGDIMKVFIITACKTLNRTFGFGRIRLERFIDRLADTQADIEDEAKETLEEMEAWMDKKFGLRLVSQEIDEAVEEI